MEGWLVMTTMMHVECKCVLCGTTNECEVVTSTNNFGGMDTEFRSYAVGWDTLDVCMQTCSNCGYTAYELDKEIKDVPLVKKIVEEFFATEKCEKKRFPAYKKYELAARIFIATRARNEKVAETLLRAAWLADDDQNFSLAQTYRKQAAELFVKAIPFERDASRKAERLFRLAEIYRRSGQFQAATDTLDEIVVEDLHPDLQIASKKLINLMLEKNDCRIMFADLD